MGQIRIPHSATQHFKTFALNFGRAIERLANTRLRGNNLYNRIAQAAEHPSWTSLLIDSKTFGEGKIDWLSLPGALAPALAESIGVKNDLVEHAAREALSHTILPPVPQRSQEEPERLRIDPFRNLLVAGTNDLVGRGILDLASLDIQPGHLRTTIAGKESVIVWDDTGFGEVRISVWWNYDHSKHHQANLSGNAREDFTSDMPFAKQNKYRLFVGVIVAGWLERQNGKHLQGFGTDYLQTYCRRTDRQALKELPLFKPEGFERQGKFYR